jgi:hypothetical protein
LLAHDAGLPVLTADQIGDGIEDLLVHLLGIMQSFLGPLAFDDFSSLVAIDHNGFTHAMSRHLRDTHRPRSAEVTTLALIVKHRAAAGAMRPGWTGCLAISITPKN